MVLRSILTLFLMVSSSAYAGVLTQPNCLNVENPGNCISEGKVQAIYIYDSITRHDFEVIAFIATQLPLDKPFPKVILNSDGGSLSAAISIGRILRLRKATVETHDIFDPGKSPMCYSACVIIAMGAVERNLDTIGIHSGYRKDRIKREQYRHTDLDAETVKRLHAYYHEMGISPEVIEIEKNTPFNKMTYFDFSLEVPLERQKIHQLGFRMRGSDARDVERLALRAERKKESTGSLDDLASQNDPEAQFELGYNQFHGANGWRKNIYSGMAWLSKAAEQNNTAALHQLAVIYSFGYEGIEVDKKKAFDYYLRAAKLGNAASQNNLAWSYYKGDGVEKNLYEAIYWATRATDRGDHFSYGSLGAIRFETDVFKRDDVETYKWLKLGTDLMPNGDAKQHDLKLLESLKARMSEEQIKQGDKLVKSWEPLVEPPTQMRDKDD
jgi:TPR repeat protein